MCVCVCCFPPRGGGLAASLHMHIHVCVRARVLGWALSIFKEEETQKCGERGRRAEQIYIVCMHLYMSTLLLTIQPALQMVQHAPRIHIRKQGHCTLYGHSVVTIHNLWRSNPFLLLLLLLLLQ